MSSPGGSSATRPPSGRSATLGAAGLSPRTQPGAPRRSSGHGRSCCWATPPGSAAIRARSSSSSSRWSPQGRSRPPGADPRETRQRLRRARPGGLLARARAAAETIDPRATPRRQRPSTSTGVGRDPRGHGEQPELLERWRECEERAGPDAPKSLFALIYFWCVDDFEAARARYAMEERWYRERGEDVWRAERLAHLSRGELAAGNWDAAEKGRGGGMRHGRTARGRWAVGGPSSNSRDRRRASRKARTSARERPYHSRARRIRWWEALRLSASRSSNTRPEITPRSIAP